MGRPQIEINWDEFDKLCEIQCSEEEIACWFRCSVDTIGRAVQREKEMNFAEYFEQKRKSGAIPLRRKQYQMALQGNVPLLIWLGKQYLGQSDKREIETTATIDITQHEARVEELKAEVLKLLPIMAEELDH